MICILIAAIAACAPAAVAQEKIPFEEYVRFHVIAENDTDEAQALKHKVCAAVVEKVRALFAECEDSAEAWDIACANIDSIEAWAREAAVENGYTGEVTAAAEICAFESREYGGMTVPAGEYRTVRVGIGAGEGRNWWCVLYPSLCMPEGYEPGMRVEFYSSIARWLKSMFGGADNG